MKRLIRALAAASLATAAFAAAPALAHDRDHRGDPCPPAHHHPGTYRPAPIPVPPARHPVAYERRELRRDYAELERARDRFYATWRGNPGKARKFERWYAVRKAELDRKWVALASW
jgi:hypothetical protein